MLQELDLWVEQLQKIADQIITEGEKTNNPIIAFKLSDTGIALGMAIDSLNKLQELKNKGSLNEIV
jgi:uncharacterized ferredoxin-like protein